MIPVFVTSRIYPDGSPSEPSSSATGSGSKRPFFRCGAREKGEYILQDEEAMGSLTAYRFSKFLDGIDTQPGEFDGSNVKLG